MDDALLIEDTLDMTCSLGATLEFGATLQADTMPDATPRSELGRGALVGRYVILDRVGAGAMGVVYGAFDPELDRKVALKLIRAERGAGQARPRLQREAQALAKLNHPNIVGVFDVGAHADELFIAMEFVEGQTLGEWMRAGERPRAWRELLPVFIAAGRGLAAAHEVGLVHRDFKPENVMLGDDGRARVMDFGLARARAPDEGEGLASGDTDRGVDRLTVTGTMLGTPAYMSLEQFQGERVDARSDQFSFCIALYEALYGERPFAGETYGKLMRSLARSRAHRARSRGQPGAGVAAELVVSGARQGSTAALRQHAGAARRARR